MFDSLVKNAIDYLKISLEDFKSRPQYSIINFCLAVRTVMAREVGMMTISTTTCRSLSDQSERRFGHDPQIYVSKEMA